MYHDLTYADMGRRRRRLAVAASVLVVIAALAVAVSGMVFEQVRRRGAESLREAIAGAALQCYAVEGAYPTSVGYLEDHYALSVRHDAYQVRYEWLGDNIPPSVVVMPNE